MNKEQAKQAKEIENFLNDARERINKEAGCELLPYKAKVEFIDDEETAEEHEPEKGAEREIIEKPKPKKWWHW